MALDGIVLYCLTHELKEKLVGGRIDKIYQIEKEDLLLSFRSQGSSHKLLLTANSNYPRLHLAKHAKNSAKEPPMFCMMLRKHLSGSKLVDITQPGLERIVILHLEGTNELGDKETKKLILEIMGRHSNIILTKENDVIIDSIKHISSDKSSVREVLPGRTYTFPPSQDKLSPLDTSFSAFKERLSGCSMPLYKALYMNYAGLSPAIAHELCLETNEDLPASDCSFETLELLYKRFEAFFNKVQQDAAIPSLFLGEDEAPLDFYCYPLALYGAYQIKNFSSLSELLETYYFDKGTRFNVGQKTGDIKKLLHTFIERAVRKKQIQENALSEAAHKDLYKIYGELLTAYAHQVPKGADRFTTLNYYEEPYAEITIPLDSHKTAIENAQLYYKQYNKAKRTEVAAHAQLESIEEDLKYLDSVLLSLKLLENEEDIKELRTELVDMGYLKKRKGTVNKKSNKKVLPFMHFRSTAGHDIYVGKNNYQNDALTMKFARSNDLWMHIKDGPGSHVIIKAAQDLSFDDQTLLEAATLAAFYSSGRQSSHVPIDYTLKKNVKKVPGAKPGMVIYTQFKTIYVTPTESFIKNLEH